MTKGIDLTLTGIEEHRGDGSGSRELPPAKWCEIGNPVRRQSAKKLFWKQLTSHQAHIGISSLLPFGPLIIWDQYLQRNFKTCRLTFRTHSLTAGGETKVWPWAICQGFDVFLFSGANCKPCCSEGVISVRRVRIVKGLSFVNKIKMQ